MISLLNGFNLTIEEQIALLGRGRQDESQLKGFREYKNQLIKLIAGIENNPIFSESLSIRIPTQKLFLGKIRGFDTSRLFDIYSHIVHMHCNRIGCDIIQEARIRVFCLHALKTGLKSGGLNGNQSA